MIRRRDALKLLVLALLTATCTRRPSLAGAPAGSLEEQLASSTYVYIATQRKDGSFGKPAEIWFLHHEGAVWVGTPPTTWRVKRIKAGRTAAKIAVGKPDGPSFDAVGALIDDPKVAEVMFAIYAKKYPDRWPGYEQRFRDGMKDGSRVLVKYTPK
jgi:hypothetical protein